MSALNILYADSIPVNDDIKIVIPTIGDVIKDEDSYYGLVHTLTAMPIDFLIQLDDVGIDFTKINEWDLFLMLFPSISQQDTSLIFGDLDLSKFVMTANEETGQIVLVNQDDNIVIDRRTMQQAASILRKINHLEADRRKPGNEEARRYLIERARIKAKRAKNRKRESQIESLIVALVNTEQYKYNFESTLALSIYQFNESARQIIKKIDYDNRMRGVYAGTINPKELSQQDLNWLVH